MRIRIVDAFTDRPFAGNPAAVVLLPAGPFPDDAWLAQVAAEVNLSETAFAHPLPDDPDADWALRWFTPTTEVAMCGHATLATAHVLHTTGTASGTVRFATRSGVLTAALPTGAAQAPGPATTTATAPATATATGGIITLDFPTAPLTATTPPPSLPAALGAPVLACYDTGPNVGDLLVELATEAAVRTLAPDLPAVAGLPVRGVIVTAAAERADADYDFVSRFFGPASGIDEDPVTGSAHTALAPLWSPRLGRTELTGLQVSARTGRVRTLLRGARTLLEGTAVTVIDGELHATAVTAPAAN
ncbi:PhzF family phenazine biosynthesis protein [Streptomyces sp. HSW2009]|uniref:PhzF family phenazine biosynthesis protein n=1 Tax=Streptomyces sp. HSW2009 TaxID=3142890 RepID=UPI0032EE153B